VSARFRALMLIQTLLHDGLLQGNQAFAGFVTGGFFGFVVGLIASRAAEQLGQAIGALRKDRTAELMVRYYDMLTGLAEKSLASGDEALPREDDG